MNQAPAPRRHTMDSDSARQGRRFCSPDNGDIASARNIRGDVMEEVMLGDRSISPGGDGA